MGGGVSARRRQDVVEALAERRELALRVDDELLHLAERLLEKAAQRPRLPAAAVALHQHARLDQRVEIAVRAGADLELHTSRNVLVSGHGLPARSLVQVVIWGGAPAAHALSGSTNSCCWRPSPR